MSGMTLRHLWYFETDTAKDAVEGRYLLERYLSDHCEDNDLFQASLVFGELLSNVIKHAPAGGVRVWLEPDGDRFALCMNDPGRGFTARDFRDSPDSRAESGRGLLIVRKLCRQLSYRRARDGFTVRAVLPVRRRCGSSGRNDVVKGERTVRPA